MNENFFFFFFSGVRLFRGMPLHQSPPSARHVVLCRAMFVADLSCPHWGQCAHFGRYTLALVSSGGLSCCLTSPRTPPSLSPTVHVLRCLAMLFFENSFLHFSHLLFPSVSALSLVHALLWLTRAFSDHRTKPHTHLNSFFSVPCILF